MNYFVSHVFSEGNQCADDLANIGHSINQFTIWNTIPPNLQAVYVRDKPMRTKLCIEFNVDPLRTFEKVPMLFSPFQLFFLAGFHQKSRETKHLNLVNLDVTRTI